MTWDFIDVLGIRKSGVWNMIHLLVENTLSGWKMNHLDDNIQDSQILRLEHIRMFEIFRFSRAPHYFMSERWVLFEGVQTQNLNGNWDNWWQNQSCRDLSRDLIATFRKPAQHEQPVYQVIAKEKRRLVYSQIGQEYHPILVGVTKPCKTFEHELTHYLWWKARFCLWLSGFR